MNDVAKPSLVNVYLKIALVVAAYWFVSVVLVFVNKYLLSSEELKLNAPLFITWFQCIVTVFLCILLSLLSVVNIPVANISFSQMLQLLPLSVVFVGMIAFNNLCLQYVGVSFYYIGRSLTTVFNVVLGYIILRQTTSIAAITCCVVIICGFLLGVDQEQVSGSLSFSGVVYGILASLFVALYSIYIKKILPVVQNDIVLLTFYNNLNAIFLFLPFIWFTGEMSELIAFPNFGNLYFWVFMLIGGTFGFAIGFLMSLQIKVTSPLTNNISGTAKACLQTLIATAWYNETKPVLWWISNGVVLLGSAAYTRVKQLEMKKEFKEHNKPPV